MVPEYTLGSHLWVFADLSLSLEDLYFPLSYFLLQSIKKQIQTLKLTTSPTVPTLGSLHLLFLFQECSPTRHSHNLLSHFNQVSVQLSLFSLKNSPDSTLCICAFIVEGLLHRNITSMRAGLFHSPLYSQAYNSARAFLYFTFTEHLLCARSRC